MNKNGFLHRGSQSLTKESSRQGVLDNMIVKPKAMLGRGTKDPTQEPSAFLREIQHLCAYSISSPAGHVSRHSHHNPPRMAP